MKFIFFCQNSYAFSIIDPIRTVVKNKNYEIIWFLREKLNKDFPYENDNYTNSLKVLKSFKSDAIIVPGNEVPHYFRGLKVQIFHGLAGEKKTHFRIRHYFDLYLTQGPYFTNKFNHLKTIHKNFNVIETGWSKLDKMYQEQNTYNQEKIEILKQFNAKYILLYAPTFTPYLTSAEELKNEILKLSNNEDYVIMIKFHSLMSEELIEAYTNISKSHKNIIFQKEKNITKFLILADLLISDTSSVVYEFLLLNKPTITYKNIAEQHYWEDISIPEKLVDKVSENLHQDHFKTNREFIIDNYHPYTDGNSSERIVDAIENHINKNGVPKKRKLSLYRKYRIHKRFRNTL